MCFYRFLKMAEEGLSCSAWVKWHWWEYVAFNALNVLICFSTHWTQETVKMPWPFSESIKKRACRYLLHRYLGNFLQEKLSLDQLSLDLYQGTGSLSQVPLDKWVSSVRFVLLTLFWLKNYTMMQLTQLDTSLNWHLIKDVLSDSFIYGIWHFITGYNRECFF